MGGDSICDPDEVIPSGFGSGYNYLTMATNNLSSEFANVNINYKVFKPKIDVSNLNNRVN
jgi:hypothetical protein